MKEIRSTNHQKSKTVIGLRHQSFFSHSGLVIRDSASGSLR